MPRNSSGTYSLYTPGNPVVTNTVISSTWANNTLADLASALTDSLSRTGDGGMQAPLELTNGAVGAPALTWASETTSGWYRAAAADFRFSVAAADALTVSSTGVTVGAKALIGAATGGFQGAGTINATGVYDDGVLLANQVGADPTGTIGLTAVNGVATTFLRSDGAPALSQAITPTWTQAHTFNGAAPGVTINTAVTGKATARFQSNGATVGYVGLSGFWEGDNTTHLSLIAETGSDLRFYTNGSATERVTISGTALTCTLPYLGPDGSAAAPAYAFANDSNTGVYRGGTDDVWMALGGTGYPIGYRNIPRSTTATTLVAGDLGRCVAVSAAIAIPASVFSAGDAVMVYNDSGSAVNITIAAGTLRLAGTATTGTRSLAARGIATLWFNVGGATPEVIASGNVT